VLIVELFLVWFDIDRTPLEGTTTSRGWDAFPRLRIIVLAGAIVTLLLAIPRQTRPVPVARTVLGLVVGGPILRRIIDPPDLSVDLFSRPGIYFSLVAAIAAALGGPVDSGRPVGGLGGGDPRRALPPGGPQTPGAGEAKALRVRNQVPSER
jgi:hypothetical protein